MWRALFIGWLAITLAEEVVKNAEGLNIAKRQASRGNTVVYGASPGQYAIQTPDRVPVRGQPQVSADYQQQSELYVISPNRKPSSLTYSADRRPQYIQVSALQLQAAQQLLQHQQLQHQQQHQPARQQVTYDSEPGHGLLYRPRIAPQPQQQSQEEDKSSRTPVQYAASAIIDSQLYPQAGSFERELAQLVAANRAQEQKYNTGSPALKKYPSPQQYLKEGPQQYVKSEGPQQYLKEVTRPAPRPLVPARLAHAPQSATPVQYQAVAQQPQLYRYVYQPEQLQQIQAAAQQYKPSSQEQQYVQPQIQQYIQQYQQQSQAQSQAQPQALPQTQLLRLRTEDDGHAQQGLRAHGLSAARGSTSQTEAPPSRSTIFVSQSTPLKKPQFNFGSSEREEDTSPAPKQVPAVRIPTQRNRPLTQEEFQSLLQSGAYTASLVPSDDPNSPHQEYLLHPAGSQTAQRPAYTNEKQESVTYLQPYTSQRGLKRRPVYQQQ